MDYEERPTSKRGRVLWVVGIWLVLGPFVVGLTMLMGWWVLLILVPSIWATWDYLQKGRMFEAVDASFREGVFLPKGFTDDRDKTEY